MKVFKKKFACWGKDSDPHFQDHKSFWSHKTVEIKVFLNFLACWRKDPDPLCQDSKSFWSHKTVEIKIFLNYFACWWKDPDPDFQDNKSFWSHKTVFLNCLACWWKDPDPRIFLAWRCFCFETECASLTVTLVVTLRKFLSLLFSIWYFQVNITPDYTLSAFVFYRPETGFTDIVSYFENHYYRKDVKSSHFCFGFNNFFELKRQSQSFS